MAILNKIRNFVKNKSLELILAAAIPILTHGCVKSEKKPIIFPNNAPYITSVAQTQAIENQEYNYDVNATDPDGDELTYSLLQAPADMIINPNTGIITWTPTDDSASLYHNISVKVGDGENFDVQNFSIYCKNTSTIEIKVKDIINDNNLSGMKVNLGNYTSNTDSNGIATFHGIEEGINDTEIRDNTENEENYLTHVAGQHECRKGNELEETVIKVIPTSLNQDFKREVLYWDEKNNQLDSLKKWPNGKPNTIYIWTKIFPTGENWDPNEIAEIEQVISELPQFSKYANNLNVIVNDEEPEWSKKGYMVIWADQNMTPLGTNYEVFEGNKITYSSVKLKPYTNKGVKKTEITAALLGGGESERELSIFNNIPASNEYLQIDKNLGKIFDNRLPGNEDKNQKHKHDLNPENLINP